MAPFDGAAARWRQRMNASGVLDEQPVAWVVENEVHRRACDESAEQIAFHEIVDVGILIAATGARHRADPRVAVPVVENRRKRGA